jgi:hypothetical protein
MARQLAHYVDPEEEERSARLLAEAFPNLGVMPKVPPIPDMTTPRLTDRAYAEHDPAWNNAEPTPEELAADEEHEALAPVSRYDLTAGAYKGVSLGGLAQRLGRGTPEEAPTAVDKTAATVAEAQKGTPATDINGEMHWSERLLDEVQKRVIDKPPADSGPLYDRASQVAYDTLGPQERFSRDERAARAREAYGEESGPSTRWEDEFTSSHKRLTDKDVERAFLLQSLMWGNDQGMKFREMQRREQAGYEEGIAKARDRDRANTRISRGLAEAIAATGQVSPEEAVNLTYGDPLVKAFSSGMYSQGGRAEGQSLGMLKAQMKQATDLVQSKDANERMRGLAMLQSLTSLQTAEMRAQQQEMDPAAALALAGTMMARRLGLSDPQQGAAVFQGDRSNLTPEQKRKADLATPEVAEIVQNKKLRDRVVGDVSVAETSADVKRGNAVKQSIELAQNDVKYAEKWQKDWDSAAIPLRNAWQAWKAMSPEGKEAFVEWAQGGFTGVISKFLTSDEDQIRGKNVRAVINALVKERSGSAVTGSEWERIAEEIGLEADSWGPFNNPEAITEHLRRSGELLTQHRKSYERILGGWK